MSAENNCPACGSVTHAAYWAASLRPASERAACRCGTPLVRNAGQSWRINLDTLDGRDTQRAIDEGWKLCEDGVFEPVGERLVGRLTESLAGLREGWNPSLIDTSDEVRGGM
jgi:hypothetical protein